MLSRFILSLVEGLIHRPPWYKFWEYPGYHRRRHFTRRYLQTIFALVSLMVALSCLKIGWELRKRASGEVETPVFIELTKNAAGEIRLNRSLILHPSIAKLSRPHPNGPLVVKRRHQPVKQYAPVWVDAVYGENFDRLLNPHSEIAFDPIYRPAEAKAYLTIPMAVVDELIYQTATETPLVLPLNHITTKSVTEPALTNTPEHLDIAFVANRYTDFEQFHIDATEMFTYLTRLYPFNQYPKKIRMHVVDNPIDLRCSRPDSIPRLITCDYFLVNQAAANVPHDTLVVIDNSNEYGGSGSPGMAVTYRDTTAWAKEVMAHEFGHSFGGLGDEYAYGGNSYGSSPWPNCDLTPCDTWNYHIDCGCFAVCGYDNLYRPTENSSLMRSLIPEGGPRYGPVSEEHLLKILLPYLNEPVPPESDLNHDSYVDFLDIYLSTLHFTSLLNFNTVIQNL